jgi:hypothetical protein
MRADVITAVLGLLAVQVVPKMPPPDLSGEWSLTSATMSHPGDAAEQPSKQVVTEYLAFNCGQACRITYRDSTVTIEDAKLDVRATAASAKVTIVVDGRTHAVVNWVTKEHTIDTVGRWEDGKLLLTTTPYGPPIVQSISIEKGQLVVKRSSGSVTQTLRYTRKQSPVQFRCSIP